MKTGRSRYFSDLIGIIPVFCFFSRQLTLFLNPRLESSGNMSVDLCESFLNFFVGRMSKVQNNIQQCSYVLLNWPITYVMLSEFEPVSLSILNDIVLKLKTSNSPQVIVPTNFLKQVMELVGPIIRSIIKMSLLSGTVRDHCKHAVVQPLLKKKKISG